MIYLVKQNVPAFLIENTGAVGFWCPYCFQIHQHELAGNASKHGSGWFKSQCWDDDSPWYGQHYFLDVIGEVSTPDDLEMKCRPFRRHLTSVDSREFSDETCHADLRKTGISYLDSPLLLPMPENCELSKGLARQLSSIQDQLALVIDQIAAARTQ